MTVVCLLSSGYQAVCEDCADPAFASVGCHVSYSDLVVMLVGGACEQTLMLSGVLRRAFLCCTEAPRDEAFLLRPLCVPGASEKCLEWWALSDMC